AWLWAIGLRGGGRRDGFRLRTAHRPCGTAGGKGDSGGGQYAGHGQQDQRVATAPGWACGEHACLPRWMRALEYRHYARCGEAAKRFVNSSPFGDEPGRELLCVRIPEMRNLSTPPWPHRRHEPALCLPPV